MPRQNRVTPFGSIIATPARGMFMGNRGCLHDEQGRIKRQYETRRWIICRLHFKNRQRTIMSPGRYTELFFLDEATALAAGHRPCAECMYQRYKQFTHFWLGGQPELGRSGITAAQLDEFLHRERISLNGEKLTYSALLSELPNGAFVSLEPNGHPYLVYDHTLLLWLPKGYGHVIPRPDELQVRVLTPRSVVSALARGYPVKVHPSAMAAPLWLKGK